MQNTYGILYGKDEREVAQAVKQQEVVGLDEGMSGPMAFSQQRAAADGFIAQHKAGIQPQAIVVSMKKLKNFTPLFGVSMNNVCDASCRGHVDKFDSWIWIFEQLMRVR